MSNDPEVNHPGSEGLIDHPLILDDVLKMDREYVLEGVLCCSNPECQAISDVCHSSGSGMPSIEEKKLAEHYSISVGVDTDFWYTIQAERRNIPWLLPVMKNRLSQYLVYAVRAAKSTKDEQEWWCQQPEK